MGAVGQFALCSLIRRVALIGVAGFIAACGGGSTDQPTAEAQAATAVVTSSFQCGTEVPHRAFAAEPFEEQATLARSHVILMRAKLAETIAASQGLSWSCRAPRPSPYFVQLTVTNS